MTFGLYLLLNVVIILFFALWIRRLVTRRLAPERILADLNEEIRTLVSELNQTGDHNISLLEDRVRDLRALLAAADRQIDDLSSMIAFVREGVDQNAAGSRGMAGSFDDRPGAAGRDVSAHGGAGEADPVYRVDFGRGTDGGAEHSGVEGASGAPGGVANARDPGKGGDPTRTTDDPLLGVSGPADGPAIDRPIDRPIDPPIDPALSPAEQVRELHLQGVSPELIATRTGMAIGEIELIISLGARKGRR